MKMVEFKKYIQKWRYSKDPIQILFPLEQLELKTISKKRSRAIIDPRSFQKNGVWNVYPIAVDERHVYIVCPLCKEIHIHGNDKGDYEGQRIPHCKTEIEGNTGYIIRRLEEFGGVFP